MNMEHLLLHITVQPTHHAMHCISKCVLPCAALFTVHAPLFWMYENSPVYEINFVTSFILVCAKKNFVGHHSAELNSNLQFHILLRFNYLQSDALFLHSAYLCMVIAIQKRSS